MSERKGHHRTPTRGDTDVIGARIGAQLIDSMSVFLIFAVPMIVLGGLGSGESGSGGGVFVGVVLGLGGAFFYHFLLEGYWDGQTIGKRLFGIKVVKENGEPCDYGSAFVRNLLDIIDGFFYYLIGFIAMAISEKRQRIGDRLAGTVVVREE